MTINTQLLYNDMTSDMETETSESTLNANIYVELKGVMPSDKRRAKEIIDNAYKTLRAALYGAD